MNFYLDPKKTNHQNLLLAKKILNKEINALKNRSNVLKKTDKIKSKINSFFDKLYKYKILKKNKRNKIKSHFTKKINHFIKNE